MAAPSPALTNNNNSTTAASPAAASSSTVNATATATGSVPAVPAGVNTVHRTDTPPKTLRGLNKPKCKQCGNVARSRCPFESCKSCCAKAQNPCPIHVLKANTTFPDKTQASSSTLFNQQSTEASSSANSHRVASFRQLSNSFSQFSNVQIPLRAKKPLTRKDVAAINEWRFSKLKEHRERDIEAENEAFDRYLQNINLLEEVLSAKSVSEGSTGDESSISNGNPAFKEEEDSAAIIRRLKLKLRSNPGRTGNSRKRIKKIVDDGLKKLQKCEYGANDPKELDKGPKRAEDWWAERASNLSDLIDKLNKARNEEDLKPCLEVKSQLFNHHTESALESQDTKVIKDQTARNDLESNKELTFSLPKLVNTTEIDQETLRCVDAHFSSIEQIENL
ncbi:hypothetical protein UlMin_001426 [Ulmus minor]